MRPILKIFVTVLWVVAVWSQVDPNEDNEGYTIVIDGCYNFTGHVSCRNDGFLLSRARVELWDENYIFDSLKWTTRIKPVLSSETRSTEWTQDAKLGLFSFYLCVDDWGPTSELYYVFRDVCILNVGARRGDLEFISDKVTYKYYWL